MSDSTQARFAAVLVVRRTIRARAEALFAAWTDPQQLTRWWGPPGVTCTAAEVELIEPPSRLIYSWRLEIPEAGTERVSVSFVPGDGTTEVIVTHERIVKAAARTQHESGWIGCLAGLARFAEDL